MADINRCTGCRMYHHADNFEFDRLGRRRKTCLSCKAKREHNKCRHGRQRHTCLECGGTSVCEHGRRRNTCLECGGASICEHGRRRNDCRECCGASICEHGRRRAQCRECGGSSICGHGRKRAACWTCDPVSALWGRASRRIYAAIGKEDRADRTTEQLLGCDKATFFHHIEAQFVDGMSWARISEIEIDHRVPIEYPGAAGGLPTLEEKVARLDYRNCQPLWAPDNMAKGNRWADPLPEVPQPEPAPVPTKGPTLTDDELADLLGFAL